MSAATYIRKRIYRWHRITGLIIALPVLLWTLSGFLHPVMGYFKPKVASQSVAESPVDEKKLKLTLTEVLQKNKVGGIHQFRIVRFNLDLYYQVKPLNSGILKYYNSVTGEELKNGDALYAAWLAHRMLHERSGNADNGHHGAAADLGSVFMNRSAHEGTYVEKIEFISRFNTEYRPSNKLLPVYRVDFAGREGLRLYVETSTGRLAAAIDDRKAIFDRFFSIAHSWSFLNDWGAAKNYILGLVALLCFASSVTGFCIYNLSSLKKSRKQTSGSGRRWHRLLGNLFVATTLLYSFSGAWHSFQKPWTNDELLSSFDEKTFSAEELHFSIADIRKMLGKKDTVTNVSVLHMYNRNYWVVHTRKGKKMQKHYLRASDLVPILHGGDEVYGCYLALRFSGLQHENIRGNRVLNKYTEAYSMMNKRLPVVEVEMDNGHRYYIEPKTGKLAAVNDSRARAERFSFSNLHMHHYWEDWLGRKTGKSFKNAFLILSTLGLLLVALTGILLYFQKRKKLKLHRTVA